MPRKPQASNQPTAVVAATAANRAKPKAPAKAKLDGQSFGVLAEKAEECPLCCESMDSTDKNLLPCPCGFQMCVFCYWKVRDECNNLCPGCRREYGSELEQAPATQKELGSDSSSSLSADDDRQNNSIRHAAPPSTAPVLAVPRRVPDLPVPTGQYESHYSMDHADSAGLPAAASWASPSPAPMSRTTSAESEHATRVPAADEAWPSLADSLSLPVPKPSRPSQPSGYEADYPHMHAEDNQPAFSAQAQVTSTVSGIRRAVCVPLSLAADAVEPYPEAAEMLYYIRQAVKGGSLSTRDAALQLLALLREREGDVGGRSSSARHPPGFAEPAYRLQTPSPGNNAMDQSTGSSAASSPYSHHQNGYAVPVPSYQDQQQAYAPAQQSVWTEASGLPGVNFSVAHSSSVPHHVQALWGQPASHDKQQGPAGAFSNGNASRYIPPGMAGGVHAARPAYKPLGLMNM